jgi:hypothetical protein
MFSRSHIRESCSTSRSLLRNFNAEILLAVDDPRHLIAEGDLFGCFTRHPRSVGESWGAHLLTAWSFAGALALTAAACLIHGLMPFVFERTASRRVAALNARMSSRSRAGAASN